MLAREASAGKTMADKYRKRRRARWYSPFSVARSMQLRPRMLLAAMAGAAAFYFLPDSVRHGARGALTWDVGAAVYLAGAFHTMWTCDENAIKHRAAQQDDSRVLILVMILVAIGSSFAAIAGLLGEAKGAEGTGRLAYVLLAALTIAMSWTVTQVVFALHYAHDYYQPDESEEQAGGGLEFPHCENPDYWDFLYFSTSIGAASQTSDVTIRSRTLRRLVTLHAIVSFLFNTMILALTVNLAASLAS